MQWLDLLHGRAGLNHKIYVIWVLFFYTMIRKFVALAGLILPFVLVAQQKKLSIDDAVLKQRTSLAPDRLMQVQWIPQSQLVSYVCKQQGAEYLVNIDAKKLTVDTVMSIKGFQDYFRTLEVGENVPNRFPFITWVNKDEFRFFYNNAYYLVNIAQKKASPIIKLPKGAEEQQLNEQTKQVAFVMNNNIAVYDTLYWIDQANKQGKSADGSSDLELKNVMLTNDGAYGLVNGKSVHRNEFGIDKGLFWSPLGNKLAYYKMNEVGVTDYELMNFNSKPGTFEKIKYPTAGSASHLVRVFVQDYAKKRMFEVQTGANSDQYLTNIAWHPKEESIYIAVVNRAQNEMKLNEYDGRSGTFIKTLITEKSDKYVEPENPMVFVKNDATKFVWMSKRDGYNQLYLYNQNGKLLRQLTTGKFDVTEFLGFDGNGKNAYYMAATNNGLDRQCYIVELSTGKSRLITLASGTHAVAVSEDGNYLLDSYSSTTIPRKSVLMDKNGAELMVVLNAANPLADYTSCKMRIGQIKAADQATSLNYRMFYPAQFDSLKKYPVLVYLYGGPHAQLVTNNWLGGADMWLYYMAQQGYLVYTIDNRGSSGRGAAFEQATFRKLGTVEREDQLEGVKFLSGLSYADTSRMGIFGWSFGGFMSISMMTRTPEFKVAVAGGPVIDWSLYEIMYTERYMDTPKENPEGYNDANLTNYISNLKGKMMIIHGTDDDVVLWQHSLTYLKKAVDLGVQVDYFVYPEHKHNVIGKDRVHLMQKITNYFNENL
jgi:dipeptidyl-peptidase-4